ncbi:hypothetical protein J2S43_005253 [Catenuloplanes nepalensis]|uniref:YcxB-like protein domain-containing protein n=1 Tax=Catenuloplanes nepalensis TaxID=587533 RepID=A0ABT9MZX0_9ACTN|nr:hypothetical protein [Catenuloplanes nepalensis]MDP9796741.1 hypothetical protein [Catenuloplanes nepalensis]
MRIEFTYARPREYFREQRTAAGRAAAAPSLLGAVLLFAAGTAGSLTALLSPGVTDELALAGLALVLIAVGLCIQAHDRWRDELTVPASWCTPREWLITDEALESTTPIGSTTWNWAGIHYALRIPHAYFFRAEEGGRSFDVPREPLTPEQEQTLEDFIVERGLVIDEPIRSR